MNNYKHFILFFLLLLLNFYTLSQPSYNKNDFILKGTFSNCSENYFLISFIDSADVKYIDTVKINSKGKFYYWTNKLKFPQQSNIELKNKININLFIAPSYSLVITANCEKNKTSLTSIRISGHGAVSNKYNTIVSIIENNLFDTSELDKMSEQVALKKICKEFNLRDSVSKKIFNDNVNKEKYCNYFKDIINNENQFIKLISLLEYVNSNSSFDNYQKSIDFVRTNFDTLRLDNLFNENYYYSNRYKKELMSSIYLEFLAFQDLKQKKLFTDFYLYQLVKIDELYIGKIRDYAFRNIMFDAIDQTLDIVRLNQYEKKFEKFITLMNNQYLVSCVKEKLKEKKSFLAKFKIGLPAPNFKLKSKEGKIFNLSEFKGKVVYIDFWASWCIPCREETPYLKEIYNKYKNDTRIVFLSIGVLDDEVNWRKALLKDKPEWIQLYDKNNFVSKKYDITSIPKFILIGKKGEILNLDAPRPRAKEEIDKILIAEMSKIYTN